MAAPSAPDAGTPPSPPHRQLTRPARHGPLRGRSHQAGDVRPGGSRQGPGAVVLPHTGSVNRQRATQLAEQLLRNLDTHRQEWPVSIITAVYVFGSYARGATDPHDLDIDVEVHRQDEEFLSHFVTCLSSGRNPYSIIQRALVGASRGYEFMFEGHARADFPLTLLWQQGDSLDTALQRLHAIPVDDTEARAPRDAMLPQFDGLDRWIPRPRRERLAAAIAAGKITVQRLELPAAQATDPAAVEHIDDRWSSTSPLYRAAHAVLADLERRGIDPGLAHLHGRDVTGPDTPYFAGFDLRYFRSIPWCLTRYHGREWTEVIHPTRSQPLHVLRILPLQPDLLAHDDWT